MESDLSLALGAAFERAEVERAVHTHGGDMAVVLDELLKGSHKLNLPFVSRGHTPAAFLACLP